MRIVLVFLLAISCVLASTGDYQSHKYGTRKYRTSDKELLQKQKDILDLLRYINQPSLSKEHAEISKNFDIENYIEEYENPQIVNEFLYHIHKGLLPKGEIFSVFYQPHLEQSIALFKLLYHSKTFDIFYKTAVWARTHFNEGQFLYALSVAVIHRPDTYGIVLPPIYEVYPHYFFNTEVIHKINQYRLQQNQNQKKQEQEGSYVIRANYSGHYLNLNDEQSLSYYMEDVGINAYYYYYNLYYPFWMNGDEYHLKNDRRGEHFYYVHQQLLARFYLERLSNNFGEIDYLSYDVPFKCGYYPSLRYTNGLEFPARPNYVHLYEYFYNYGQKYSFKGPFGYSYTLVRDYERRIRDAIDSGYIHSLNGQRVELFTQDGFNILGNLIEANPDSPNTRYYGQILLFARHLLGYSYQPQSQYQIIPSALEHFETSLRDPAFYRLFKRIILLFQKYKYNLHSYTYNELAFQGVKVESVNFDRLVTYYDTFDSDVSNVIYVNQQEYDNDNTIVRVRQNRLNHKPFTYKINVKVEQPSKAVVRVYLGPKYDEYGRRININENRMNFVEIDRFSYDLVAGKNTIERNSYQSYLYATDRTGFHELYNRINSVINGDGEFQVDGSETYYGYPQRYMLPKGKVGGQAFQVYVIVSPYHAPAHVKSKQEEENTFSHYYPKIGTGGNFIDSYPLGYPFDRHIDEYTFYVPNSYFQEVVIYHKNPQELNASHQHKDIEIENLFRYGREQI